MLKFIRKYQLYILVVGGSLLMVVFLLQPILTRLKPSPLKAKVAMLDDGTSYSRQDIQHADGALSLLKRVYPRALASKAEGGLGLDDPNPRDVSLHWLMLVKQAQKAGLIGEAGDGASWVNDLAQSEALIQLYSEIRQGQLRTAQEQQDRLTDLHSLILNGMTRNATNSAANVGGTMNDVYKILAQARGIKRLLDSVPALITFSDVSAIRAAHESLDAVAVNAAVLDSSMIDSSIPEPSDEQLQSFFDTYKAQSPADNEFRIGYTQPTRMQLGWLTLDKNVFMNAVKVDRIEMSKIYQQNRDQYPGDIALERPKLEQSYRDEQATNMMIEADRIIRAQVLSATKGLPSNNGVLTLPADWDTRRPTLEEIANAIVESISNQFSISLPIPSITIIGDRWLNANAIISLPGGYGTSSYRIGSRQILAYQLPQFFESTEPNNTGLDVQVGLPMVDPPSTDAQGNRYYAVILGVRKAGPADSIGDVTRDQVVKDFKSVEGYKALAARIDEFRAAIKANGSLAGSIDLAIALAADPQTAPRPGVFRNLLVRRDRVEKGRLAAAVDPKLNAPEFRDAVHEASKDLPPLATPEEVIAQSIPVVVGLPQSHAVALALVIAPRPATVEGFRSEARNLIAQSAQKELIDAGLMTHDPFSFEALTKRYGLTKVKDDDEKKKAKEPKDEPTPAPAPASDETP